MKQLILLLLFSIMLMACEKVFHPGETAIGIIESPEEMESAVLGMYGKLAKGFTRSAMRYQSIYSVNVKGDDLNRYAGTYDEYYDLESPDCYDDGKEEYHEYYTNEEDSPYETPVAWKILYGTIISANNIIVQFDLNTLTNPVYRACLGEAYLIRAYCYYRLVRTYGQIPIIDDIEISYTVPGSSFLEIFGFIESDLKIAANILPESSSQAREPFVSPHRGVAKALLAELYLSWGGYPIKDIAKYSLAAQTAEEVIDSAELFGISLLNDFAHLWDQEHFYNSEDLLTIYFPDISTATSFDFPRVIYGGILSNGPYIVTGITTEPGITYYVNFYSTEINFYNNYPKNYRKDITFFTTIYVPWVSYRPAPDTGYVHVTQMGPCSRAAYRKFYLEPSVVSYSQISGNENSNNYISGRKVNLFRYAHTLLTYAEAKARSGKLDALAYEAVNRIRRRANNVNQFTPSAFDLTPGLSPEIFADSVVAERAWELAGELEGRWFDLLRLEMVEALSTLRHPEEGGPPGPSPGINDYYFQIPEEELFLNPNL